MPNYKQELDQLQEEINNKKLEEAKLQERLKTLKEDEIKYKEELKELNITNIDDLKKDIDDLENQINTGIEKVKGQMK